MVTIKDVAKDAGVAISTVSNVLNGVSNTSEETKIKVLKSARKLRYMPNINAKLLRSTPKKIVGVFLSTIQGEFYSKFIQGIHKQCEIQGYILQIYIINEEDEQEVTQLMTSFGISAGIVLNSCVSNAIIDRLSRVMPMVLCDRNYTGINVSNVIFDNYNSTCEIIEHLISNGHRNIGYFHGSDVFDNRVRFQAYKDTLIKHNIEINSNIIINGHYDEWAAHDEIIKFIENKKVLPDAFFCANDRMAIGCVEALKKYNIKVPNDISIAGFDDDYSSQYFNPALSTVAVPSEQLGHESVVELMKLINSEDLVVGETVVLKTTPIFRNSVKLN